MAMVFLLAVIVGGGYLILRFASPQVILTEAVEGPVVQAFYSTGTVQPEREFPIKSNVAGLITEIKVDKGDHVKAGQPLAVVSAPGVGLCGAEGGGGAGRETETSG